MVKRKYNSSSRGFLGPKMVGINTLGELIFFFFFEGVGEQLSQDCLDQILKQEILFDKAILDC